LIIRRLLLDLQRMRVIPYKLGGSLAWFTNNGDIPYDPSAVLFLIDEKVLGDFNAIGNAAELLEAWTMVSLTYYLAIHHVHPQLGNPLYG
jgi:hypothetical protein